MLPVECCWRGLVDTWFDTTPRTPLDTVLPRATAPHTGTHSGTCRRTHGTHREHTEFVPAAASAPECSVHKLHARARARSRADWRSFPSPHGSSPSLPWPPAPAGRRLSPKDASPLLYPLRYFCFPLLPLCPALQSLLLHCQSQEARLGASG